MPTVGGMPPLYGTPPPSPSGALTSASAAASPSASAAAAAAAAELRAHEGRLQEVMRAGGRAVDETCAICLGPLEPEEDEAGGAGEVAERRMVLRCGHIFHRGCVGRWSRQSAECPTCKQPMVLH